MKTQSHNLPTDETSDEAMTRHLRLVTESARPEKKSILTMIANFFRADDLDLETFERIEGLRPKEDRPRKDIRYLGGL